MDLFNYKPHENLARTSKLEIRELFDGEMSLLLAVDVYSMYSEKARNAATVRDKIVSQEDATDEQKEAAEAEYIASLVAGWEIPEGHTLGGKRLKYTHENAVHVATNWITFGRSVLTHAAKITNYGDKAKKS
jgi:hypothetical protein